MKQDNKEEHKESERLNFFKIEIRVNPFCSLRLKFSAFLLRFRPEIVFFLNSTRNMILVFGSIHALFASKCLDLLLSVERSVVPLRRRRGRDGFVLFCSAKRRRTERGNDHRYTYMYKTLTFKSFQLRR